MQRRPLFFTKATTNLWRLLRWDFWTVHGAEGLCRINSSSARAAGEELIWLNSSKFKNLASVVGRTKLSTSEFLNSGGRRKSHQKKKEKENPAPDPPKWSSSATLSNTGTGTVCAGVSVWVCDGWLVVNKKEADERTTPLLFFAVVWKVAETRWRWQQQTGSATRRK